MPHESSQGPAGRPHRVVMIVDAGSNPFEMGVATELFGLRRPELERPWYDFTLCAAAPSVPMHNGFFTLSDIPGLDAADDADTLIAPNRPDSLTGPDPAVPAAVRRAAARGARLVSFCTGAWSSPPTATAASGSSSNGPCPPYRTPPWRRCWPGPGGAWTGR